MSRRLIAAIPLVALLAACAGAPMTVAEHREAAKNRMPVGPYRLKSETYVVKRPFAEVARTFDKKAAECLSGTLTSVSKPVIGFGQSTHTYGWFKPTVLGSAEKAELHFQAKFKNEIQKSPEDGVYYLVADASPASRGQTRIDVYWINRVDLIAEAVRGWATGDNPGCPDLLRMFR